MSKPAKLRPPRLAIWFLTRLLRHDLAEEVLGDLEEKFYRVAEERSLFRATLNYWFQVFNYLRPFALKGSSGPLRRLFNSNTTTMVRHNILLSFRQFVRHKAAFSINLAGLSSSFALALLIVAYAGFELSFEKKNPLADRLVRITMDYLSGGTITDQDAETYPPMGPRITEELPEVINFTRAQPINETDIQVGEKFFRQQSIFAVDPSFFQLFNYPLIQGGQTNIFLDPHETVLTESLALRYFGTTDVVGETIRMISPEVGFKVVGVVPDSPPNTHLKVEMLVSYASMRVSFDQREDNWDNNGLYTYLLLADAGKVEVLKENLVQFTSKIVAEGKVRNEAVIAQPIKDIHLYSHKSFELEANGDAATVYILLGVAVLIIFVSFANYINLSTSRALDRAKEVGIRKVVGASINQLRGQFLTEAVLMYLAAGVVAVFITGLVEYRFKFLAGIPVTYDLMGNVLYWQVLLSLVAAGGFLSGIIPAVLLSKFQPMAVLKGRFGHASKGGKLRQALVVFQFGITAFLVVQTLVVNRQISYMREKELGANINNTIVVRIPQNWDYNQKANTFKNQLLSHPQFESVAISNFVPGQATSEMGSANSVDLLGVEEKQGMNFYMNFIDADFIPTMRMSISAGSNFLTGSENKESILVNEEAVKLWGISNPQEAIGKTVHFWGRSVNILGVVKNFHQSTAKSPYLPMIFIFDPGFSNLVSVRLRKGDLARQIELIENTYSANFSNSRLESFFLDQQFDQLYRADESFQQMFGALSAFAIFIACLGLFGLSSYAVAQRTKEIGIRKVLGASAAQIVALISKDFVRILSLAILIAFPITLYLVNAWLDQYAFRIKLNLWHFTIPALIVLFVSLATVLIKALGASNANPVNSLRNE